MTEEQIKDYTLRISQANYSGLAAVIVELALVQLHETMQTMDTDKKDIYQANVKKAERYVSELISSMNLQDYCGLRIARMLVDAHRNLVIARISGKHSLLQDTVTVLEELKPVFDRIAQEDHEPPVMQNTQKVYAGLTYGKHSLNEMAVDPGKNRGYQI